MNITLYRVKYYTEGGISAGFSWHPSMAEARAAVTGYIQAAPDERRPEIEPVQADVTAMGVLALLQSYAGHPDNG